MIDASVGTFTCPVCSTSVAVSDYTSHALPHLAEADRVVAEKQRLAWERRTPAERRAVARGASIFGWRSRPRSAADGR